MNELMVDRKWNHFGVISMCFDVITTSRSAWIVSEDQNTYQVGEK